MAYLALYRAFRPDTLDGVVRQEHIVKILRNQIAQNKVGHAYLFCGPRGTGKTSIAKIFARAINCERPVNGSPCGECPTCKALREGKSLDVVEIDAASNNGVDEMRDLREKVQYPPVNGRYKVYIVDEVHMLSAGAFNALLKTLEEPPAHAVFILATTEAQKIPATILSRCMRFDFKLIPQEDLENHLKSVLERIGKPYEDAAVAAIARAGAGSVRDMLSLADMCVSYEEGKLTYEAVCAVLGSADFDKMHALCSAILRGEAADALERTEQILASGKGIGVLVKDILNFLNECSIAKMCRGAERILALNQETFSKISETAKQTDGQRLLRASEIFAGCETSLRYSSSPRIVLETAVMKAAAPETDYELSALAARIAALETALQNGAALPAAGAPSQERAKPTAPVQEEEEFPPLPEEPTYDDFSFIPSEREEERGTPEKRAYPSPATEEEKRGGMPAEKPIQPPSAAPMPEAKSGAVPDRSKAFGMFLRALRKTCRNGVLFTLCSELESSFEGDTMILSATGETIFKSLNRPEHRAAVAAALESIGVTDFDIRLKGQRTDDFKEKLDRLKEDFPSTPIEWK